MSTWIWCGGWAMSTRTRVANKTLWALDDIVAATQCARTAWRVCHTIAERRMEPLLLAKLGTISDELARIETTAREARKGNYVELQ
jgi:hypothetical protein